LAAVGLSNAEFDIFTSPTTQCVHCGVNGIQNSNEFDDNNQQAGNSDAQLHALIAQTHIHLFHCLCHNA
jgi:hypothetical protein